MNTLLPILLLLIGLAVGGGAVWLVLRGNVGHALAVLREPWLPPVLANTFIVVGASTVIYTVLHAVVLAPEEK